MAQWASSAGGGKAKGKKRQAGGAYSAARHAANIRAAKPAKSKPSQSRKGGNAAPPPGAVAAAPPSAAANTPEGRSHPESAARLLDQDDHDASAGGADVETAAGGPGEEPLAGDASTWLHMDESVGEEVDSDETARDASTYGPRGRIMKYRYGPRGRRSTAREEGDDLEEGVLGDDAMVAE